MTRVRKKDDGVEVRRVTWVGLFFNALLTAGKFVVGIFGGSEALVADAVHSASDFATDIAVIVGSHFWNSPPDEDHPYGHRRFETLVTIAIGIAVAMVGVGIGYRAVVNLVSGKASRPEFLVAIMAFASIVVKELLFRYTRFQAKVIRSQALHANAFHHRSDAFSSIPVLVAVAFSLVFPELWFADSVGAVIVAFFILHSACEIAFPGVRQLVDRGADAETSVRLKNIALSHPCVLSLHGFRSRYVASDLHVDLHIVVDSSMSLKKAHDVAEEVEELLIDSGENVVDALVHVDPYNPDRAKRTDIKTIER